MGGIFGGEKEFTPTFFLDFENAQPTDAEKDVYNQVQQVVEKHTDIMQKMSSYKGITNILCSYHVSDAFRLYGANTESNKSANR